MTDRKPFETAHTRGASARKRFRAASVAGFEPSEGCLGPGTAYTRQFRSRHMGNVGLNRS
jgi:hypothetical protein